MLLHLEAPLRRPQPAGQVLAVEPNPVRANTLRDLLRDHAHVDLQIVPSVIDAIRSIGERVPDLVITSTFLPPSDEAELIADLKGRPGASHVQVIIVPHFTGQEGAAADRSRAFRRSRRTPPIGTSCDLNALRDQIAEYLQQARTASTIADDLAAWRGRDIAQADAPIVIKPELRLVRACDEAEAHETADTLIRRFAVAIDNGRDRRRAPRRSSAELPWLWSAQLTTGTELKLVDVSNSGVLVETAAKLPLGSTVDLRLIGQDTDLLVPAHVLRSAVAEVNPLGVRYHVAAAFSRELHLLEMAPGGTAQAGAGDVARRELEDVVNGVAAARVRFEQELRRLLAVRDILIRQTPVLADDGADSVYFSIPDRSGSILQVIFERDHEPSAMEFQVLRAAARLAAAVLECAPSREAVPVSAEALAG